MNVSLASVNQQDNKKYARFWGISRFVDLKGHEIPLKMCLSFLEYRQYAVFATT